jgi:hypothetical protein
MTDPKTFPSPSVMTALVMVEPMSMPAKGMVYPLLTVSFFRTFGF